LTNNDWKTVEKLAARLGGIFGAPPEVVVTLGSGLGEAISKQEGSITAAASDIEDWPFSTVEGHRGRLTVGMVGGVRALILQGRVHLYEGYSPAEVVRPVRAAVEWGARTVVLTNAAGAVGEKLEPGELMLIADHLNLTSRNPLVGLSNDKKGPRFPDMTSLYDSELQRKALEIAGRLGIGLFQGVYAGLLGPSYETPAEVSMLRTLGAEAVGMSTVLEAIAARHMGARVAGISCITNKAAGLKGAILDHSHVQKIGKSAAEKLARLLLELIPTLGE
jgi:purine-nucleoside phosphorylase